MHKLLLLTSVLTLVSTNVLAESGTCGDNCTWNLTDGTLTISGTGKMDDYSSETFPWYDSKDSITNIVINEGITSVGSYACYKCDSVTSVSIPNTITTIKHDAFYRNKLTDITLPDSVTFIGNDAFLGNRLTSVTIPDSVRIIGGMTFQYNQITSVTIPDSVTEIGSEAFYYNQITNVTIPDSVTTIGYGAFSNNKLTSIVIPDSVISIGSNAFKNNPDLTSAYCTAVDSDSKNACETYFNTYHPDITLNYYTKDEKGIYTIDGKQYASIAAFENGEVYVVPARMRYTVQEANELTSPKDINKFQVKFR